MSLRQKIEYLKANHLSEWLETNRQVEEELSDKQAMCCVCGKLATGLHESRCKKFNKKVIAEAALRLKHLIEQAKVSA